MTILHWPLILDQIEQEFETDCVPLDDTPLHDARRALWRAIECGSSMLRCDYLYRARDALIAAELPRWAEIAEAAAIPIGGTDKTIEWLLFEVDLAVSRQEHAEP